MKLILLADRCGIHVCVCSRLPAGRFSSRGRARGADAAGRKMSLPDNTPPAGFTSGCSTKDTERIKDLFAHKGPPGLAAMTPDRLPPRKKLPEENARSLDGRRRRVALRGRG